jgi:tetratricopeptide (TPR) repeat protein
MRILFVAVLFCMPVLADIPALEKECFESKKSSACNILGGQYRAAGNFDKAFDAVKKSCDLMDEFGCSQMQSDSLRFSKNIQNIVVETLAGKCEQKEILCGALAHYYENKKDYKNAIQYSKRAFQVSKTGNYPYLEYKYGNRKTAYKISSERCEADQSSCDFYIRYMPTHPNFKKLVAHAKDHCLNHEKDNFGATTCSVLGAYFESRKRHDESVEVWSKGCERVDKTSCALLIASQNAKAKEKENAFRSLCEGKSLAISQVDAEISEKYCKNQRNYQAIPEGLLKIAQTLLKSFVDEQK